MTDTLTQEQRDFLGECEEEFKDRFTDKDEEFMRVFNAEPSTPPIVEPWHSQNQNRRNNRAHDRRHGRRDSPYHRDRRDYRDRNQGGGYQRRDARERRPY